MKQLKIWTIVSFSFVIIAIGHGIAPMLLVDFFSIHQLIENGFSSFNFSTNDSETSFIFVGLFSLLGKLLIFLSMLRFIKKGNIKNIVSLIGLFCLFISFYLLIFQNKNEETLKTVALFTGTPFLISSFFLFVKSVFVFFEEKR